MPIKPDVFVVVRQPKGGRPMLAYPGAVFNTHAEAMDAMRSHRESLARFSKRDSLEVYVHRTNNKNRIR